MTRDRVLRFLGIIFFVFILFQIWLQVPLVFLNFSASVPRGVYVRIPLGEIHVGDCVAYLPDDDVLLVMREFGWLPEEQKARIFLKNIGALPGDSYSVNNGKFYIRGDYYGDAIAEDSKGHLLPIIQGSHIVPDGEFLPVSPSPRSFDGRHTGPVPLVRIIAKVIPILVVD